MTGGEQQTAGEPHVAAADCEADSGRWVAQPVNALSSWAATAAGLWVIGRGRSAGPARRGAVTTAGWLIAANGPGGFAYHGPGGRRGRWLHDAALVGTLGAVAAIETSDAARRPPADRVVLVGTVVAAGVLAVRPSWSSPLQALCATATAVAVGVRAARDGRVPDSVGPAALLGVGAVVHAASRTGCRWCRPGSRLQGHAAWHLLSAAALGWWGRAAAARARILAGEGRPGEG